MCIQVATRDILRGKPLGDSGVMTPPVGLGTWAFGSDWAPVSKNDSLTIITTALSKGILLFDTADIYGHGTSELLLREALGRTDRADYLLLTKGGRDFYSTGRMAADQSVPRNFSYDYVRRAISLSLKRLGVEYIDIYLLHDPSLEDLQRSDIMAAVTAAKLDGEVRLQGLAVHTPIETEFALQNYPIDVLEFPLSVYEPLCWKLVDLAAGFGVGLLARSVLSRGTLAGTVQESRHFHPNDHRSWRWSSKEVAKRAAFWRLFAMQIAECGLSMTCAQAAIRYVLDDTRITAAILGVRTQGQLAENIGAATLPALPKGVRERLHTLRTSFEEKGELT